MSKRLLLCGLVILLPLSSFAWQPKYWSMYGDFSLGTSTRGKFTTSTSLNFGFQKFCLNATYMTATTGWSFLSEYDVMAGKQFIESKQCFAVLCGGLGYLNFYHDNWHVDISRYYTYGIPLQAKFYYAPFKHAAINGQVFYNFNRVRSYGGVAIGLSFGLFNWSNVQYYAPSQLRQ